MAITEEPSITATSPVHTPPTHREILLILVGIVSGMALAGLDGTIVSTALPTIVGELGGLNHLSWVITAYLLTSTVSTPLYGKLSDLHGRRIMFQAAIVIFLIGSVLAGISQSMVQLVLFRGIQGIGGGGLLAMSFAIIGDVVPPRERGRYTGFLGGTFAVTSVIGPLLGGFLVDNLTWRWIFYVNLPVGLASLFITSAVFKMPHIRQHRRIDVGGAVLLVTSVTSLLLVLVWGGRDYAWTSSTIIGLASLGLLLAAAFVWWENRAVDPILPLRLFRNDVVRSTSILAFIVGAAMFGSINLLPIFLQVVKGQSATNSGLLLLPMMLGMLIASIGSGRLTSTYGRYRHFPIMGFGVLTASLLLFASMGRSTPSLLSTLSLVTMGLAMGAITPTLTLAAQNAVDHVDLGTATSAQTFFRTLGGTFGVAIFGAVFAARLDNELPNRVPAGAAAEVGGKLDSLLNSPAAIRALPPPVRDGVIDSVAHSLPTAFLVAAPVALIGFLLAWTLREIPLKTTAHVGVSEPL